jgi:lipoprotein LpqH
VTLRNIDGFTGNYNLGLEGEASVTMTGATYDITGVAPGYRSRSVERTAEPFKIRASC